MLTLHRLTVQDISLYREWLHMFGAAFDDPDSYTHNQPGDEYIRRVLASDTFVALAVLKNGSVVGGLAAYELIKFEQERSEFYIYDLAVLESERRQGIATALIAELQRIAYERGAYVIFVQADTGEEDAAAIALYSKLGVREQVLHFDLPVGIKSR